MRFKITGLALFAFITPLSAITPNVTSTPWWDALQNYRITQLVQVLVTHNIDLKITQSQRDQAQANIDTLTATQLPEITAFGQTNRGNKSSLKDASISQVGVQATLDLDLFGKTGNEIKAAQAQLQAREVQIELTQKAKILTLIETILNWEKNALIEQELSKDAMTLDTQLKLTQSLVDAGLEDKAVLNRLKISILELQTQLANITTAKIAAQNKIAQLLALPLDKLTRRLFSRAIVPIQTPEPALVNSDQEPAEIKAAKYLSLSTDSSLKQAESKLWPTLSLTGLYARQDTTDGVFQSSPSLWDTSAKISLPLFNNGRISSQIKVAQAAAEQSQLQLQNSELENTQAQQSSYTDYRNQSYSCKQWAKIVAHTKENLALSISQFDAGQIDGITYLQSQRALTLATISWLDECFETARKYAIYRSSL